MQVPRSLDCYLIHILFQSCMILIADHSQSQFQTTIQFLVQRDMEQSPSNNKNNENKESRRQLELFQRSFGIQMKGNNNIDQPLSDASRNIFLQEEKEEKVSPDLTKKTKKLKIFGISENKINRQSFQIPDFFEIQEVNKVDAPKDVGNPVLFESKIDIHIDNGLKASKQGETSYKMDQNENRKVLQRLLELSQSSASVAKPSEPSQSQHSVQTNEIDQLLKIEIMEKSYLKPHNSEVSNSNKRVLKVTESEFVEIKEEEEKKEENAEETKKQQRSQVALEDKEEKVKEVNVLLKERRPSSISQQEPSQKKAQKSQIKDEKVKRLEMEDFVIQNAPQKPDKHSQKIRRTKKAINQQYFPQKNLKNYLQRSKSYDKDIEKMIDKLEKVSSLKCKQKNISQELNKLNEQKKSLSSRQHHPIYICSQQTDRQPYSIESLDSEIEAQNRDNLMFARSIDNFKKNDDLFVKPEKILQEELKRDVHKMQKIIDRFKAISQTISIDTQLKSRSRQAKIHIYNMKDNPRGETTSMMKDGSQTQSFFRGPNNNTNPNETEQIVDSGVYKTIKLPYTERINQTSQDCKNISLKTEKKFCNTISDNFPALQEKQCPCTHQEIVQQINRLKEKIEKMQINKCDPSKFDINDETINKHKEKPSQDDNKQYCDGSMRRQEASLKKELTYRPKKSSLLSQTPIQLNKKEENSFQESIDFTRLSINFPKMTTFLVPASSESAIVNFGETQFARLLEFASLRRIQKEKHLGRKKMIFKIKKYEDCIHFHTANPRNYHLVYYYKGKIYFGEWKDSSQGGCKQGFGYFLSPNKYIYEGQFQFDKKYGKGIINYKNGEMYEGQWINNKKDGKGILINSLGDVYTGSFANGKKNGLGEEKLKNGDFYRGMFKDGKLNGEGTYWWANGSVYKGGFRNGLLHGKGVWKSKENDSYEGEYRNNKKYGQGTSRWSNGMIFSGYFKEDETFVQRKTPVLHDSSLQREKSASGDRHRRTPKNTKQNNHLLHKQN